MVQAKKTNAPVTDAYEAAYMGSGKEVTHREKISYPRWFRFLMPLVLIATLLPVALGSIVGGDPMLNVIGAQVTAAVLLPVALLALIVMSTLRVTVTSKNLHIQYGVIGPSIPLSAIEHCEAEHYSLWKYGGYGIRYSISERAWCYNMLGDKGQAVRIHWRDKKGKLRRTLVASQNHEALAAAINDARANSDESSVREVGETVAYTEEQQVDLNAEAGDEIGLEEELAAVEQALAEVVET